MPLRGSREARGAGGPPSTRRSPALGLAVAPTVALALVLAGCVASSPAEPQAPAPSRALARIAARGELRVGMSGEQPPLTMTTRDGELLGLDVALARVLARSMGVEARFVRMPFGRLLDALEAGEIEMVMSGMTITPARSQRAIFVGPYYTSGKALLTRSERLAAVREPAELDAPELRLAVLAGSTSEAFARRALPRATRVSVPGLDDAIHGVVAGEVDALLADRETCHFAVLRHPGAGLRTSGATFTVEPMGIAVPPGDERLAGMIEAYLEALEERGVLQKARDFWFRDDAWVEDLE